MHFTQPTLVLILKFPPDRSSVTPSIYFIMQFSKIKIPPVISLFLQLHTSNFAHLARVLHFSMLFLVSGLVLSEGRVGVNWVVSEQ
jgi:hypothetical protein